MGHTLTLEVPKEMYEPLVKAAEQTGRTPEELAVEWLATAIHQAMSDPVEDFIGALSSNAPDWADQHDKYIGQALIEQMHSKENEGS
jgi:hypothetical protein